MIRALALAAAAASLVPSLAFAQARARAPRIPDRDMMFQCPLEVSVACAQRCQQGQASAACPWADFGCDFKVCWAGQQHILRGDLQRVIESSASYALPGAAPGQVNALSIVRVTDGAPDFLLLGGRFIVDVYGLTGPAAGRARLQAASACAAQARAQQAAFIQRSASTDVVYRVTGCGGRVGFASLGSASAPAVAAAPQPVAPQPVDPPKPPPPPQPAAGGTGSSGPNIQNWTDEQLRNMVESTGRVEVQGHRILVDGVDIFSPRTSPEDFSRIWNSLDPDDRVGLKVIQSRTVTRAMDEAQRQGPAPAGQEYVYNPETGRAELRPVPPPEPDDGTAGDKI